MSAVSEVIRQLLIDLSLAQDSVEDPWSIFFSFLPDKPNNAICAYDTAGRLNGRMMRTGEQVVHQGIQIRIRGLIYEETHQMAQDIALGLDALNWIAVAVDSENSYVVQNVSRTGDVISLGLEEDGPRRYHFVINATVTLTKDE